jgi:DNA mismatch repair protein MSH2
MIPLVKPRIHPQGQGDLILENARHPCLEQQDHVNFIANDLRMLRNESRFLIITGRTRILLYMSLGLICSGVC